MSPFNLIFCCLVIVFLPANLVFASSSGQLPLADADWFSTQNILLIIAVLAMGISGLVFLLRKYNWNNNLNTLRSQQISKFSDNALQVFILDAKGGLLSCNTSLLERLGIEEQCDFLALSNIKNKQKFIAGASITEQPPEIICLNAISGEKVEGIFWSVPINKVDEKTKAVECYFKELSTGHTLSMLQHASAEPKVIGEDRSHEVEGKLNDILVADIQKSLQVLLSEVQLLKVNTTVSENLRFQIDHASTLAKSVLSTIEMAKALREVDCSPVQEGQLLELHSTIQRFVDSFQVEHPDQIVKVRMHISESIALNCNAEAFELLFQILLPVILTDGMQITAKMEDIDERVLIEFVSMNSVENNVKLSSEFSYKLTVFRLCNEVVRAMGGDLAHKVKGGQSLIQLRLLGRFIPHGVESKQNKKSCVLIVDDNKTNLRVLEKQLQVLGIDSESVGDGLSALEISNKNQYGMILTDFSMPGMDGIELIENIRERERNLKSRTPIILVSANMVDETRLKDDSLVDDFLTKPISVGRLADLLRVYMPNTFKESQVSQKLNKQIVGGAKSTLVVANVYVDIEKLFNVIGPEFSAHRSVLTSFLDNNGSLILELEKACLKNEREEVSRLAHKLKSSSRSVCAIRLSKCVEELEKGVEENRIAWSELIVKVKGDYLRTEHFIRNYLKEYVHNEVANPSENVLTGLRVLVLDDDETTLLQISSLVKALGARDVYEALEGNSALHLMDGVGKLDLLVCDLQMPQMDGIEFLRHVAQRKYQGGVVLVSGGDEKVLRTVGGLGQEHKLNVLGTLHKPVTEASLAPILAELSRPRIADIKSEVAINSMDIRRGLIKEEFELYFQAKMDVRSLRPCGVEALLRWHHPHYGVLSPKHFIPLAEKTGLIDLFTPVIFKQASTMYKKCQVAGFDLKMSINLSVDCLRQLSLPEELSKFTADEGLDVTKFIVEVTESRIMDKLKIPLEVLTRLRLKGFGLSIDDFGTGYSTLEQLRRIPFGELKIDKAFVKGAHSDKEAKTILETSISLAKKLGLLVVAEGVETRQDYELVVAMGCDIVQGYFVSKALGADHLVQNLNAWDFSYLANERVG